MKPCNQEVAEHERFTTEVLIAYRMSELGYNDMPDDAPHDPEELAEVDAEFHNWLNEIRADAWSLGVGVALYCGPHDIPPNPYKQATNHQKEETMNQTQEDMKVINRVRFIDIGGHMINVAHISHIEPYENWNPEKPGTTLGDPGTRIWMNNGRDLIFHDLTIDDFCDIMTSQLASDE